MFGIRPHWRPITTVNHLDGTWKNTKFFLAADVHCDEGERYIKLSLNGDGEHLSFEDLEFPAPYPLFETQIVITFPTSVPENTEYLDDFSEIVDSHYATLLAEKTELTVSEKLFTLHIGQEYETSVELEEDIVVEEEDDTDYTLFRLERR